MEKQLKLGQFDLLENASSRFGPQLLRRPHLSSSQWA